MASMHFAMQISAKGQIDTLGGGVFYDELKNIILYPMVYYVYLHSYIIVL
jgi:septal ring-binding cell division protein DamX